MATILELIATKIIREQQLVIGPLAWREAGKVEGLSIDSATEEARISGADPKSAIDGLVAQYERLFGRASREVSRESAAMLLPKLAPEDIPSSLRI